MTTAEPSPPASPAPLTVSQSIHVELPVAEAFELFTDGINEWWPLNEGYAHGGDQAREIYLEAREGGRFFERLVNGDDLQVGRVTVCEPPDRIVFTWPSPDWREGDRGGCSLRR